MGKRRKARECALQALYEIDTAGQDPGDAIQHLAESFGTDDPKILGYAESLIRGVWGNLEELDAVIQEHSPNWTLERMARVDRNILRLAAFELRFREDVPLKVVLNEAIEVAKRFGAEGSAAFINGVLDRLAQTLRGEAPQEAAGEDEEDS
ncbi:MAG: transcription antitermination factor NusB [Deltaproteobacteria bacterium]|nr:transcription antitermination factor NusB [Deltaproteobacteria bacterium]